MKLLLIIFFTFFLTISKAQTYKCEYEFDEDIFELTLNKVTEYSYEVVMNFTSKEYILFENEDYLILGNPMAVNDKEIVYRNIFLDKKNKLISLTSVIEPKFYESYTRGVWGGAIGRCD